jgi:hypothetical protein
MVLSEEQNFSLKQQIKDLIREMERRNSYVITKDE